MHHDETGAQNSAVRHLHELVRGIQFAMLTTTSETGLGLRSRPMTLQKADGADGDFWFFVGKSSAPARDVVLNPQVNLAFSDPAKNTYVSVSGEAELILDRAKARELWSPAFQAWFPKGIDDPELMLLRVRVHTADYWDAPAGKLTQLAGLAKSLMTGERAGGELGAHEHLGPGELRAG